jgi:hypothetical protein
MKLNGLDIRLGIPEANAVCNSVTGGGFNVGSGVGDTAGPYFIWNGSNWALASNPTAPMNNLICNLNGSLASASAQRSSTRTRGQVKVTIRS